MCFFCFFCAFIVLVYNVRGQCDASICCNNASHCIEAIDSHSNDSIEANGYKSLFQSPSSLAFLRTCSGALSCKQTPHINTQHLWCLGSSSCSNSGYIQSELYVKGHGANALINTNISSRFVDCYGDKSCAQSSILSSGSDTIIYSYGALSLFETTINVMTGSLSVYLYGYYAGYRATIYCQNGTICNIHCAYNGCGGLSLICDTNSECNILNESMSAILPNNLTFNMTDILFWNSTAITTDNDENCSAQTTDKTFDNYQEYYRFPFWMPATLFFTTNVGPICCRASRACSGSSIRYNNSVAYIVCSGYRACYGLTNGGGTDTDYLHNALIMYVECSGKDSCFTAFFNGNGGNIYCYGHRSCLLSYIVKISNIYCTAYWSCQDANIVSSGTNITVYLTGFQSGYGTNVTCNENDHCTILCMAFEACLSMDLSCFGTCFVECDQDTSCPIGWTANPTSNPTLEPTELPSRMPSLIDVKRFKRSKRYNMSGSSGICGDQAVGFLNTTYQLSRATASCNEDVDIGEVVSILINSIDTTYGKYELLTHSNISHQQRESLENSNRTLCDNIVLFVLSCFNNGTNKNALENVTKSHDFEADINDAISNYNNSNMTFYVYIQNVTMVYIQISSPAETEYILKKGPFFVFSTMQWILIIVIFVMLLCVTVIISIRCYKRKQILHRNNAAMIIQKAMVILIGVGDYDTNAQNPDVELQNCFLSNLSLSKDISNLCALFGSQQLNYSIYPQYEDLTAPNLHWTQAEILSYLKEKAAEFDKSAEFDALICIFSGHGMCQKICTSDYKLIEKLAVHRLFSKNYYAAREKPRIFMFDCCEGDAQYTAKAKTQRSTDDNGAIASKCFSENDIEEKAGALWAPNTSNPDFKLVQVDAANAGFQSKLHKITGSCMITSFVDNINADLIENNGNSTQKFLGQILDEIQKKLHCEEKKQLIVVQCNNNTRNIIFKKQLNQSTAMAEGAEIELCDGLAYEGKTVLPTKSKSIPNKGPKPDTQIDEMLEGLGDEYGNSYKCDMEQYGIQTYHDLIAKQSQLKEFVKNENHLATIINKAKEELYHDQ